MEKLNYQRLTHFLAVVDAGSLSKAAVKVGLSQPALTKSIRKLEDELDFPLFDRTGIMELTPLGREFLPRVRDLVGRTDDLEREMSLLRGGELGELKVVCGATVAETVLAPAISRIVNRYPRLRIRVKVGLFRELPELLRSRQIDLGLGDFTSFEHEDDLEILPLEPEPVVFVCRTGHPLVKKRGPVTLEQFFSYPVVSASLPDWAIGWLRAHHPEQSESEFLTVECNHYSVLTAIIAGSDAVSGIPEAVVREALDGKRLARLRLKAPALVNRAGIIFLKNRTLSPAARILAEAITGAPLSTS